MRNLNHLNNYRQVSELYGNHPGDEHNGVFIMYVEGRSFVVIASNGGGWDHVSIHPKNAKRCPTWEEMCAIKAMFFDPEETVMQLHPPESEYVNNHPYCLHLWRPQTKEIPLPPRHYV